MAAIASGPLSRRFYSLNRISNRTALLHPVAGVLPHVALVGLLIAPSSSLLLSLHHPLSAQIPFVYLAGMAGLVCWLRQLRQDRALRAIDLVIVGVITAQALAFIAGPYASLWGAEDSYRGLATQVSYALILALGAHVGLNGEQRRAVRLVTLGSVPVLAYALLQALGLDWIDWQGGTRPDAISSTIGGPNDLAGYVLLILPCWLYVGFTTTSCRIYASAATCVGLSVGILLLTGSRSGILCLALMLATLAVVIVRSVGDESDAGRRALLLRVLARARLRWEIPLLLVLGISLLTGMFLSQPVSTLFSRSSSQTFPLDDSVVGRLDLWRGAFTATSQRWLIGFGQDSVPSIIGIYQQAGTSFGDIPLSWSVTSFHNWVLDEMIFGGVLGLASVVIAIGYAGYVARRCLSDHDIMNRQLTLLLGLSSAGYLVHSMIHPMNAINEGLLWLLVGLTYGVAQQCQLGYARMGRSSNGSGLSQSQSGKDGILADRVTVHRLLRLLAVALFVAVIAVAGYAQFHTVWPEPIGVPGPLPQPMPYPTAYVPIISASARQGPSVLGQSVFVIVQAAALIAAARAFQGPQALEDKPQAKSQGQHGN